MPWIVDTDENGKPVIKNDKDLINDMINDGINPFRPDSTIDDDEIDWDELYDFFNE